MVCDSCLVVWIEGLEFLPPQSTKSHFCTACNEDMLARQDAWDAEHC